MAAQHRDVMRALLGAIDAENWAEFERWLHPDTRYEAPGYPAFDGRAAVLDYYSRLRPIESGEHVIDGVLADADHAVSWGRFRGSRRDGSLVDVLFSDLVRFERGLVRERRVYIMQPLPRATR